MNHPETPHGLAERLAGTLPAATAPVRPLPATVVRALILFAILAVVTLAFGFSAGGKGWRALHAAQRWSLALPLLALLAWFSWEVAVRMMPGARIRVPAPVLALMALLVTSAWAHYATPYTPQSRLFYVVCIAITTAGVGINAWLARFWLKRGLFTADSSRWALAALFGLAGFTVIELFCPYVDAAHILTSHVVPGAIAGILAGTVIIWYERKK